MAVEFELPVLHISMSAVDKMQGPDALRALWTVFTKTTGALEDGTRLENMTWRLWHRQLMLDRTSANDTVAVPKDNNQPTGEIISEDDDSGGEWEDDSTPPSRDPAVEPTATYADKPGFSTRRQSSTAVLQPQAATSVLRSLGYPRDRPALSVSQPIISTRPVLTSGARCNSSPDGTHHSHGTNIGRIISHLLPEKLEVASLSPSANHPTLLVTAQSEIPSTPASQPVQLAIHSPSTPPNASYDLPAHLPPTLMVIHPTPRPTPPDTPSSRARAVPTNIPSALLPVAVPLALNPPSTLDHPHSVLLPCPSASEQLVSAAALPLTPTVVSAPELPDDDAKKKIFYVQSPEGATASDDGRSHSSSNSNTNSNVTDPHVVSAGNQPSSLSSATTNEPVSANPLPEAASPAQGVSGSRGTNHTRTSSGNNAYIRSRAAKGAKVTKPAARAAHRGRPNALVRTTSNSSDKSRGRAKPCRQRSVSEDVVEDIDETEGENKQTSASTSHTVTSLPKAPVAHSLSMTPAAKSPEQPRNNVSSARILASPAAVRQTPSSVRSPPNVLAPAALVAPFTTMASAAPSAPSAHSPQPAPSEAPRPQANNNNNSSALMGLGRRTAHVETSSDFDLESDSEELWSDDETDSEDPLARAANEANRQRSLFEKVPPKRLPRQAQPTGLLTNLMNPDPRIYPQAAFRQHNSAQNLAAGRRPQPPILQTSRSTVAVPMAATVNAEQVTTHVSVDPKGRAVATSEARESRGSRGLRLQGPPEAELEEEGSTDEENPISNELSKTYAQRRLEALASRARVPPPPPMEQVRHVQADANTPALAPRPAPQPPQTPVPYDMDVRPIHSPRTVRRKMIAGELSESLRRNLMWERTSTRFAMGAGALRSGLRPLTEQRPGIQATHSDVRPVGGSRSGDEDAQERSEARRLALARNKSWANDFHHAGW